MTLGLSKGWIVGIENARSRAVARASAEHAGAAHASVQACMVRHPDGGPAYRAFAALRRCRLLILISALAIAMAAFPAICRAQTGGLGFLTGGTFSYGFGTSGNGLVVVGQSGAPGFNASQPPPYGGEAVLWNLPNAEAIQALGVLAGGTFSIAYGTNYGTNNTSGSVVVGESGATNFSTGKGFIWTAANGMEDLGTLAGGTFSFAYSVNANSTSTLNAIAVGQSGSTQFPLGEAFIWQSGTMTGLGALTGDNSSTALGMTPDGTVVVGYSRTSNGSAEQAFRWTSTTGMVGLGTLTGGTQSYAQATNSDGSVIVGSSYASGFPNGEAFRWTCTTASCSGGTMVGLCTIKGGTFSYATAVSADGLVVVGESGSTAWPNGEAFIWTPSTGMLSLQQVLSNANLAGWNLTYALGISADGTVISGYGTNPSGQTQAWVAHYAGPGIATDSHDFNGDGYSDIAWRDTSGDVAIWLMNGTSILNPTASYVGTVPTAWSIQGAGAD